ncbi:unnamed protein product, partial [marine sediment metagenome]
YNIDINLNKKNVINMKYKSVESDKNELEI